MYRVLDYFFLIVLSDSFRLLFIIWLHGKSNNSMQYFVVQVHTSSCISNKGRYFRNCFDWFWFNWLTIGSAWVCEKQIDLNNNFWTYYVFTWKSSGLTGRRCYKHVYNYSMFVWPNYFFFRRTVFYLWQMLSLWTMLYDPRVCNLSIFQRALIIGCTCET